MNVDYLAMSPLLVVTGAALVALVGDLFVPLPQRFFALWVAVVGSLGASVAALAVSSPRRTFCVTDVGCSYVLDDFTVFFIVLFGLVTAVFLLLSVPAVRHDGAPAGEYAFLTLSSLAGTVTLAGARDLVTLLVGLVTLTVPAYVLAGLRRADPRSAEAALKFFVISVVSSAVTLFGISLIYGVTGSVHFGPIARALASRSDPRTVPLTAAAVFLVLVGFAFKVSAVPFHWWAPDTYQGAPVPVAAYLSTVSKAGGFAGLLLVVLLAFRPYAAVWGTVLAVLAAATMTLGNLVALRQRHAVRLLAWSSVAQAGYMLAPLGVAAAGAGQDAASLRLAGTATMGYLALYVAMNLGAFGCVVWFGRRRPRGLVADYRGLARRAPWVAAALAFFLLCLAGLPPGLAGMFAKIVVFRAALSGGAGWLAVLMAVNTVVGLYYYLRWAASLYAAPTAATPAAAAASPGVPTADVPLAELPTAEVATSRAVAAAIALAAAATVLLGFLPQLVLGAAHVF